MVNAILRRFELMSLNNSELPSGYKRLEFIASANGAYIDSGLFGSNTLDFEMVAYSDLTSIQAFFGNRVREGQQCYLLLYDKGNNFYQFDVDTSSQHFSKTNNVVASKKGNVLTLNDVSVTQKMNTFTTAQHIYILGLNNNGGVKFNAKGIRIYSLKFSENGTLIRDYIPARRLSDNKVGMYDKVEGKFYTSAHDGYEFKGSDEYIKLVDLGLTSGTLWSDRNVGANKVIDYGLHYAWGETDGYSDVNTDKQFNWTDYKYANGDYNKLTKYCNNSSYGNDSYADKLTTLETTDDASYSVDTFVMPTKAQLQELIDETTYTWTTKDGVAGGLFASKVNSNSIFIPASGGCFYSTLKNVGEQGNIWSSSLYESTPNYAWLMRFDSSGVSINHFGVSRCDGCSIRGVKV